MANSPWMIPNQSDKTARARQGSSKRVQGSPARTHASFAALMAREQNGTGHDSVDRQTDKKQTDAGASSKSAPKTDNAAKQGSSQTKPAVARLPELSGLPLHNPVLAGRSPNDLLRMQNFNKATADIQQTKAVENFMRTMVSGASTLDIARGLGIAKNLRTIAAAGNGRGFALTANDFIHTSNRTARGERSRRSKGIKIDEMGLGKLSARFESGKEGIAAIGYDSAGGTSYGKYQIASRVGSMKNFLSFLDEEAPDLSRRLRKAGPANTGSRYGAMPDEWRAIAREQPERFEQLQESFIRQSHYKPALEAIEQCTGIDSSALSSAMREVIWSTAVQHGPAGAARIFARADGLSGKPEDASYERKLINNVYNLRAGQFGSSTHQIRNAVRNRFRQEREMALNMLDGAGRSTLA